MMGKELRPFMPLNEAVPEHVVGFLRRNPTDCMCYYPGTDLGDNLRLDFFVKIRASEGGWFASHPKVKAILSLSEHEKEPVTGEHMVFARAEFKEPLSLKKGSEYRLALNSEFPVDNDHCMWMLDVLVRQEQWVFHFVNNACDRYYNSKVFNNPLSTEDKRRWQERIEAFGGRSTSLE